MAGASPQTLAANFHNKLITLYQHALSVCLTHGQRLASTEKPHVSPRWFRSSGADVRSETEREGRALLPLVVIGTWIDRLIILHQQWHPVF